MNAARTQRGMTLVEVAIGVAALVAAFAVLFGFLGPAVDSSSTSATLSRLGQDGDRAMARILDELLRAEAEAFGRVRAPLSTDSIQYRHGTGVRDGAVDWGGLRELAFERDPADPDDGLDNDGDGLIDEGQVVLRTDVGEAEERTQVLITGVPELLQGELDDEVDNNGNGLDNEAGFCLDHDADTDSWTVRLTVARRDYRGRWFWRTFESGIAPRN